MSSLTSWRIFWSDTYFGKVPFRVYVETGNLVFALSAIHTYFLCAASLTYLLTYRYQH